MGKYGNGHGNQRRKNTTPVRSRRGNYIVASERMRERDDQEILEEIERELRNNMTGFFTRKRFSE